MTAYKRLFLQILFIMILAACGGTTTTEVADDTAATEVADDTATTEVADDTATTEEDHDVHWGYEGEGGPDHWAALDAAYELCGTGTEQSPIDIPADAPANAANLHFDYSESAVNILNNGHTIQVNYDEGSTVEIDGETYSLLQFHFHAPSENRLASEHTPMEMHLVHANADGGLAVVGVMLVEGAENPAYASVLDNMPAEESDAMAVAGATVNALDLLPEKHSYYRFDGSLTTPPCSEAVKWHVMDHTVELSADQIAQFTELFDNNYRPVQPMNDREFIVTEAADDHAVHWGYEGEGGPDHWAALDTAYELCGTGIEQSPIDLTDATAADIVNIEFDYDESAVTILNNGHTIQVNYDAGSHIDVDGHIYNLLQFHFHAPSEHSVGGELYPAEMHLVHADEDGNLAVVGIFISDGAENEAFASVWDHLPPEESEAETVDATVNALNLLPDDQVFYRYGGSLTTPPCSEGVLWSVIEMPVEMSAEQIEAFTAIFEGNNRPVQLLNDRDLQQDETP